MKRKEKEGYTALQLGCGAKKAKQVIGTELGHFRANGVPIKRKLQEFRVTEVRAGAPAENHSVGMPAAARRWALCTAFKKHAAIAHRRVCSRWALRFRRRISRPGSTST